MPEPFSHLAELMETKVIFLLRTLISVVVIYLFAEWVYYNPRILPSLVFLLLPPALVHWRLSRTGWVVLAVFAGYLGLYLVPFDITFKDVPGPPKGGPVWGGLAKR